MLRRVASLLALVAGNCVWGQSPEIRGTVIEAGRDRGIAGVEVTITDFVPNNGTLDPHVAARVMTDANGKFVYPASHLGDFKLDLAKPGYEAVGDSPGDSARARGIFVVLSEDRPAQSVTLLLMQPSFVTGRVVDQDDKPVAGLLVALMPKQFAEFGGGKRTTTGADGSFSFGNTQSGPSLIRIESVVARRAQSVIEFSEEAAQATDEDYEQSYWPGGTPDAASALPFDIVASGANDFGTIKLRRTTYYRAHLELSGCTEGEKLQLSLGTLPRNPNLLMSPLSITCQRHLVLRYLKPGSYDVSIATPAEYDAKGQVASQVRWASVLLEITRGNTKLPVQMMDGIEVAGRFTVVDGVQAPDFTKIGAALLPANRQPVRFRLEADAQGNFVARNVPWPEYMVQLSAIPGYYVKEIRYAGRALTENLLRLASGARLEIVLDGNPASISGTIEGVGSQAVGSRAADADEPMVILTRWPADPNAALLPSSAGPFTFVGFTQDGRFQFTGLAPGDYRIAAIAKGPFRSISAADIALAGTQGMSVKVDRGMQKTLELKPIVPQQ